MLDWLKKVLSLYKKSYFPDSHTRSKNKIKVVLDFKKSVDTSEFAKKTDLASFKSDIDKLDVLKLEKVPTGLNSLKSKGNEFDADKFETFPTDLSKLSDVVKNEVIKKTEYDELVKKS